MKTRLRLSGLVASGVLAWAGTAFADETIEPAPAPAPAGALTFKPDAGIVYQSGDFKITAWGFAERVFDPDGPDSFRRVRQGAEIDFPRVTARLRPALVYEIDLTNSSFFDNGFGGRDGFGRRNLENLFIALQDPDDPGRFRVLVGENTHILSRDDNLSSGNLPTINRSLILEELGSVNGFGTQFGVQVQTVLPNGATLQLSAQDGRGSFNAAEPRYTVGNSLAAKIILTPINDPQGGRKLTLGLAADQTGDIQNRTFTLATAIGQAPLGGLPATGDRRSWEVDAAYTFPVGSHPVTVEGEAIYSSFSGSRTEALGGYGMVQWSLFDTPRGGDLDLFVRYDIVRLGQEGVSGRATQQALRTGINYNLPGANRLANLHLEYAHNTISGPSTIVTGDRESDEFRVELRVSLQQYVRH